MSDLTKVTHFVHGIAGVSLDLFFTRSHCLEKELDG